MLLFQENKSRIFDELYYKKGTFFLTNLYIKKRIFVLKKSAKPAMIKYIKM